MKRTFVIGLLVCAGSLTELAHAQQPEHANAPAPENENGAVQFYGDAGWSFNLPAVRAGVVVGGVSALSPEKKTLAAPSFGMTVTAWKFVVPFFDMTVYDTGKATASVGPVSQTAQASTLSTIGGLRFVAGHSRLRAYAELGGGVLHQNLKGAFAVGSASQSLSASASIGSVVFGGGAQIFGGRHWGSDLGFDVFHLAHPMTTGGQNYGRVRIGIFYQTKSTVK